MAEVLVEPPAAAASEEFRMSDRFPDSGLIEGFGGGDAQLLSQGEDEEGLVVVVVEVLELSVVERIEERVLTSDGFRKGDEEEEKKSK